MDISCAKCGEPWDSSLEDMEGDEAARFRKGEGCPCCRFGTACSLCDGTGHEDVIRPDCQVCRDKGFVLAFSPRRSVRSFQAGQFYVGYAPHTKQIFDPFSSPLQIGTRSFPEQLESFESADGWVDQWWVACPERCTPKGATCVRCKGSGHLALTEEEAEHRKLEAARSALDASDSEPISILIERGLL